MKSSHLDAVYFYYGILEAYEIVGEELIGSNVLQEQVIPRMLYYVRNFLPSKSSRDDDELAIELMSFMKNLKDRVSDPDHHDITLIEIWRLRAAIFGYESAFIEILGDSVIKKYVLKRIPEILTVFLPEVFTDEKRSLEEKLQYYTNYLIENKFAKFATFSIKNDEVTFNVNKCTFADIHDSDAYLEKKTRFCPWGMMMLAIVNAHKDREFPIESSTFVTRGAITKLKMID